MRTMIITDITVTQKGRYALFVDDNFLFSVDDMTYYTYAIAKGKEVDSDFLDEVYEETMFLKAKELAFSALSYKGYSTGKLREKLAAKTTERAADRAVLRLEELGLLNDDDYAKRLVEHLINNKKYGKQRIQNELSKHKVDKETAQLVLEELEREDYLVVLKQKLRQKFGYPKPMEKKERDKMINAQLRAGHSYDDIRTAMRQLMDEDDFYEEE